MKLIIIRESKNAADGNGKGLLRFALSSKPLADVILDGISRNLRSKHGTVPHLQFFTKRRRDDVICAVPEEWGIEPTSPNFKMYCKMDTHNSSAHKVVNYTENVPIFSMFQRELKREAWFVVSDGRFATQVDNELLDRVLAGTQADVVVVNVKPGLLACHEKVRLTNQNKVAGFRRLYSDPAEPAPIPVDWPNYIFVKTNVLERALINRAIPERFSTFLEKCWSSALTLKTVNVAGEALDLETGPGLLNFCMTKLLKIHNPKFKFRNSDMMSQDSRFIGKVLLGENIRIGPKVIVMGPTIIGDNVIIERGAVINSSIIGSDVLISADQIIQHRIIKAPECDKKNPTQTEDSNSKLVCSEKLDLNYPQKADNVFRDCRRFSYLGSIKRIADFFAALIVLILFAPVMPFIALAIKMSSPGKVFYKDRRQGLHGKEFNCLKFRTMTVGANKIQEKLRIISEVDGPQFKMEDDPRLNAVGNFLRETYIDEIPQFFNVLLGQMSVIGPRPSPESENTLCPFWRDARLSVRPGITGLWQVCRTRQPMKDFQEWIYYDTRYVRDLSLKMDLWICWKTVVKMVENFIKQF